MNNHYHLLIETPGANLSQIMHHINSAYTMYFNVKYERAGHLFQGRYKAILVDVDEYAKELSRYIHLNPVRAGIVDDPEDYPWSSYSFYIGKQKSPKWLVKDFILSFFSGTSLQRKKRYKAFVLSVLDQKYENPLRNVVESTILGSAVFVEQIQETYLKTKKPDRDLPALRRLAQRPNFEEIKKATSSVFGRDQALMRHVSLYFLHKYSGKTLKEIGGLFGIGESGVSQASRRLSLKLNENPNLRRKLRLIEKELGVSRV
jgi:putative transposase